MLDNIIPLSVAALVGGATLIQIAPIKINPWSYLARCIGRAINKEVMEQVNSLQHEINDVKQELNDVKTDAAEREAKETRVRILRFGDEILHGVKHSKEHFDQILLDITEYSQYCEKHPSFKNDMTRLTTQQIMKTYTERLENHDFL